jgi:RNA recognition motif-containing protein
MEPRIHPSRTLFIRNIASETKNEELEKMFSLHGPLRKFHSSLIPTKGIAFGTFYDLRHAEVRLRSPVLLFSFFFFFFLFSLSLFPPEH